MIRQHRDDPSVPVSLPVDVEWCAAGTAHPQTSCQCRSQKDEHTVIRDAHSDPLCNAVVVQRFAALKSTPPFQGAVAPPELAVAQAMDKRLQR